MQRRFSLLLRFTTIIFPGFLLLFAVNCYSRQFKKSQPFVGHFPKLFLPNGSEYNLGLVMEDTKYSKDLTVGNCGSGTLILTGIRTSCGCTVANASSDTIAPGDSVLLHIVVNTRDFIDGPVKKDVYFETNDSTHRHVDIILHLVIRSIIQCIPTYINFSNIAKGDSSLRSELIKNNTDTTITIDSIISKNSQIITKYKKIILSPGDSASFTAIMRSSIPGNVIGQVDIYTDYSPKRDIKLSYLGYVKKGQ